MYPNVAHFLENWETLHRQENQKEILVFIQKIKQATWQNKVLSFTLLNGLQHFPQNISKQYEKKQKNKKQSSPWDWMSTDL